jgi:hypothetical protein
MFVVSANMLIYGSCHPSLSDMRSPLLFLAWGKGPNNVMHQWKLVEEVVTKISSIRYADSRC